MCFSLVLVFSDSLLLYDSAALYDFTAPAVIPATMYF